MTGTDKTKIGLLVAILATVVKTVILFFVSRAGMAGNARELEQVRSELAMFERDQSRLDKEIVYHFVGWDSALPNELEVAIRNANRLRIRRDRLQTSIFRVPPER